MTATMHSRIKDTAISRQILGEPGFSTDIRLSAQELSAIRGFAQAQWLARLTEVYPQHSAYFAELGMDRYHRGAHLIEHEALWPKRYRLFSPEVVHDIAGFSVIQRLTEAFGAFEISDVVYGNTIEQGRKEIYWRLVRPNATTDVGPLHADKWFHAALGSGEHGMFGANATTIKIWLALFCEPGRNGLMVVPNSHRKDWRYENLAKSGAPRPVLREDINTLPTVLVPTDPGTLLIFNEKLLHGGAINQGETTRVSLEITMVFD